jgi:DNA-binding transcriptional ArsR family regulator
MSLATYGDVALGYLADPTRRRVLELLAREPTTVGQLAKYLPISRPAVSQHLRVLRDAGLVSTRAAGTRVVYQVNPEGVAAIRAYLDTVWRDALDAFQRAANDAAGDLKKGYS